MNKGLSNVNFSLPAPNEKILALIRMFPCKIHVPALYICVQLATLVPGPNVSTSLYSRCQTQTKQQVIIFVLFINGGHSADPCIVLWP